MFRLACRAVLALLLLWAALSPVAGLWLLPNLLLHPPTPVRSETFRADVLRRVAGAEGVISHHVIPGGEGRGLEVQLIRRPRSQGLVVYLHGFGDDAWGTLGRAQGLPAWDAACFTFRGRDQDPAVPCTLGGWERVDLVAVVRYLLSLGYPPERVVLAGWSMGAGVGLLALEDLGRMGIHLGGALLECPFQDLPRAARDHLRTVLGGWESVVRPAERVALWRAGRMAHFDWRGVSPLRAASRVTCPVALVTGTADRDTPLEGVRAMARFLPDLTVVPGAGQREASDRLAGGWGAWARSRLERWGLQAP